MTDNPPHRNALESSAGDSAEGFLALSQQMLLYSNRGLPRIDFVREVSKMILDFSACDAVEVRLRRRERYFRCITQKDQNGTPVFRFEHFPCMETSEGKLIPCLKQEGGIEKLCRDVILGQFDPSLPSFTKRGSFWTNDLGTGLGPYQLSSEEERRSLTIIPLILDQDNIGVLQMESCQPGFFTPEKVSLFEGTAQTLGVALVHRHAQVALRERIKELTCLYGIARLVVRPGLSVEEMLQEIVKLLPPAWLYPEIATARITLDDRSYVAAGFGEGKHKQSAEVLVSGKRRGAVEVIYREERPELDEGAFLTEERSLIDAVAREVALIIERKQAEEERIQLHNQLMHADRLATIGQLAAGVAHELNEPLGSILGFAQLVNKCPGLPPEAVPDIEKIVNASLHAREVVKKLLIFARQMPTKKTSVKLNQIVEEGLYFFESRCNKEGIELVRHLSPNLPYTFADSAQLHQVLVNLVVNAIQAMPEGGKLTIQTLAGDGFVSLVVEDTGIGMDDEIKKHLFVPFFTTKGVGEGTGLGLSVVHGIISSHGGTIKVESQKGVGSRFEIQLPIESPANEPGEPST
jgi:two-component system NtrC family sensor kinase